jgi:hypothetical protein
MSKAKQMVDLKPKAEKITEEQLQLLQSVVNDNNAIQYRIGGLEAQKHELLHQQVGVQSKISELQSTFSKEYGTFDVDLQDGTINYSVENE